MLFKEKSIFCKANSYILFSTKDFLKQIQPLCHILFHEPVLQVMNVTLVSELLGVIIGNEENFKYGLIPLICLKRHGL